MRTSQLLRSNFKDYQRKKRKSQRQASFWLNGYFLVLDRIFDKDPVSDHIFYEDPLLDLDPDVDPLLDLTRSLEMKTSFGKH